MTTEVGTPPSIERLADRAAIDDLLNLHSRGLDRQNPELIQQAYWPDANVDYGAYKGSAHVFAGLVVEALAGGYELTRHSLSNTLVHFSGERALAESVVRAAHLLIGAREEMQFYGRYLDAFERRDGVWKLQHRQVVMDWSKRLTVSDERGSEGFSDMAKGVAGQADPLYGFLK